MAVIQRRPPPLTPKPAYGFGSTASRLASKGLSPRQVDAAHPAVPRPRGAGFTRSAKPVPAVRRLK